MLLNAKPNGKWKFAASITGEGHSAVYLSRVCAATAVTLRMCSPGEAGAVIQNYEDYKEDQPYEWNAVPLNIYLYGVEDEQQRPLYASPEIRTALQDLYRETRLRDICTTPTCISDPGANWRDSVAAAFVREIYIFEVRTTVEQDERFVREFNARANVNHYSGFTRNCADFAKLVVNTYFPHSAHRDFLNDFGMTGPKAIARSFSHYSEKRPEMEFRVDRIEQLPGTYERSTDTREGTEQTFRAKKWLLPMMVFTYHVEPILAASYLLTGRFSPDHELRRWPSMDSALMEQQIADAKASGDKATEQQLTDALFAERTHQLGDEQQWQKYRDRFEEILNTAIADGVVTNRKQLRRLFHEFSENGSVYLESNGDPWLAVNRRRHVAARGIKPAKRIFAGFRSASRASNAAGADRCHPLRQIQPS